MSEIQNYLNSLGAWLVLVAIIATWWNISQSVTMFFYIIGITLLIFGLASWLIAAIFLSCMAILALALLFYPDWLHDWSPIIHLGLIVTVISSIIGLISAFYIRFLSKGSDQEDAPSK